MEFDGEWRRIGQMARFQDTLRRLAIFDGGFVEARFGLDGLDYVQRNTGPGLRLVVSSRSDPLLPLHRYRLAGQVAEIRASDLAFSTADTEAVLAQHGVTLSAGALECLTRRTEGWAAGVRLAALSLDTHPDPDQFARELAAEDSALTRYRSKRSSTPSRPKVRDPLRRGGPPSPPA